MHFKQDIHVLMQTDSVVTTHTHTRFIIINFIISAVDGDEIDGDVRSPVDISRPNIPSVLLVSHCYCHCYCLLYSYGKQRACVYPHNTIHHAL